VNLLSPLIFFSIYVSAVFAVSLSPGRCTSVCLSRSCIVSRLLKMSSNIFLGPVVPSF